MNNNSKEVTEIEVDEIVFIDSQGRELPIDLNAPDPYAETYKEQGKSMDSNFDFLFNNGSIRPVIYQDKIWFIAKEICDYLEYKNPRDAIRIHVTSILDKITLISKEEISKVKVISCSKNGQMNSLMIHDAITNKDRRDSRCSSFITHLTLISEFGVYALALRSKMPKAREFFECISQKLLPSVRRFSMYTSSEIREQVNDNPDYVWWANSEMGWFDDRVNSDNTLLKQIANDIAKIKLSDTTEINPNDIQAKYWCGVAGTIYRDTCNHHMNELQKAKDDKRKAEIKLTKVKQAHKEELIRRDTIEKELRDRITKLERSI